MSNTLLIIFSALIALVLGGGLGFYISHILLARRTGAAEREAARILAEATTRQKELLVSAKEEALKLRGEMEAELKDRRSELQRLERRLGQKEEALERKVDAQERRERTLSQKERELEHLRGQVEELRRKQLQQLEMISGMSTVEAKDLLLAQVEKEMREDLNRRVRELEVTLKEEAEQKAREILVEAIQRCATDVVSETTVTVVPIPSDDMKGRLIGREGRNIRALENATGVDLIIDDTPEAVTLSSFDPIRREVARVALQKLILDGRIHPGRIEEVVQKARAEVEAAIKTEGEQAAYKTGVPGLHPELIKLLGRLKYRTSYGQNVLQHSLEVAYLASMLAGELGAETETARTAGLLHDVGKAVDHEVEGTHAAIGAEIVARYGRPELTQAIAEHHGEAGTSSLLGFLITAADAISGGRPGARRDPLEQYIKRLEALESVANSFPGVEKSFAIQAGREVRIMVKPEEVDDLGAVRLSRDIVKKIQETLQYPGQIKVTVIRETRAVDYAK